PGAPPAAGERVNPPVPADTGPVPRRVPGGTAVPSPAKGEPVAEAEVPVWAAAPGCATPAPPEVVRGPGWEGRRLCAPPGSWVCEMAVIEMNAATMAAISAPEMPPPNRYGWRMGLRWRIGFNVRPSPASQRARPGNEFGARPRISAPSAPGF